MKITVSHGSQRMTLDCREDDPIGDIRQELEKLTRIPAAKQRLIFRGKSLSMDQDEVMLRALGVKEGARLMVMGTPRGDEEENGAKESLTPPPPEPPSEGQELLKSADEEFKRMLCSYGDLRPILTSLDKKTAVFKLKCQVEAGTKLLCRIDGIPMGEGLRARRKELVTKVLAHVEDCEKVLDQISSSS